MSYFTAAVIKNAFYPKHLKGQNTWDKRINAWGEKEFRIPDKVWNKLTQEQQERLLYPLKYINKNLPEEEDDFPLMNFNESYPHKVTSIHSNPWSGYNPRSGYYDE